MLEHLTGPDWRPSRVLIVGRSGFLARRLSAELARDGIPFDTVGRPEVDLTAPSSVDALRGLVQPDDALVILSALTPDKGRDFRTLMKNFSMAEHLGELFERCPCAHVVYVSSDAVYDGRQAPIDEDSGREPVDLYALMHTGREMMLQSVLTPRQVPLCILRPVALFGAGDTHNSYGPNRFVREAFDSRTITLFGRGEDQRSHVCADDAARLIAGCLLRRSAGILNLASPHTMSFRQVAELVQASCPFPTTLTFKDRPGSGPVSRRPFSDRRLREAFPGFEFTPMTEAVSAFVAAHAREHGTDKARTVSGPPRDASGS
jgi:UDP-glucose 4-epimerase